MNERELEQQAQRLGEQAAARLDVERVVARVAQRLRSDEEAADPSRFPSVRWLRIAAALVVLMSGGLLTRTLVHRGPSHPAHWVADDLRDLSSDELAQILGNLDDILADDSTTVPNGGMDDLNEQQLQTLLKSLEG